MMQPGFAVTRVLGFDPSTDGVTLGIATAGTYPGLAGTTRAVVRLTGRPQAIGRPPGGAPPSLSGFPGLGAYAAAKEIDGFIDAYQDRYGNFNALLTGGDIVYLASHLKNKIFADPELIFKGLYAISEVNNI